MTASVIYLPDLHADRTKDDEIVELKKQVIDLRVRLAAQSTMLQQYMVGENN